MTTNTGEYITDLRGVELQVVLMANSVINQVSNFRVHPTYTTKTELRNEYQQLLGAYRLASRIFRPAGMGAEAEQLVNDAQSAIKSLDKRG
jgi:hypothetical protein